MIAFRIHKRPFNPTDPAAKNVRILVAQFTRSGEAEARLLLKHLQKLSTAFTASEFSHFRYTFTEEPEPVKSRFSLLPIDLSSAKPTPRPIGYSLSWEIAHGECKMLAYSDKYGAIRATIPHSPEARQAFVRQIKQVWPNAEIKK